MRIVRLAEIACVTGLLAFPAAHGARAASPAQQSDTYFTSHSPRISLTNLSGTVLITGWDRPQVYAVWAVRSPKVEIDREQVPSHGEAAKIRFVTHLLDPAVAGPDAQVDYTLEVPAGASLEIRNSQGTVRINNLSGDTWVQSVGGDVFITGASGQINASTMGGQIELVRPAGDVQVSSVTGDLRFVSPTSTEIHGGTLSGRIIYEGSLAPAGDYVMRTYSGDIEFLIPPSSSYELMARSDHGKLVNQLKLDRSDRRRSRASYGDSLLGMHNRGAATLELTSFKGIIRISPQPTAAPLPQ